MSAAKTAAQPGSVTPGHPGSVTAPGYRGHRWGSSVSAVPEPASGRSPMAQRWAPLRRQHAGRTDAACIQTAGAISNKPIAANRVIADTRRTVPYYSGRG
jgi:hypothetical protein